MARGVQGQRQNKIYDEWLMDFWASALGRHLLHYIEDKGDDGRSASDVCFFACCVTPLTLVHDIVARVNSSIIKIKDLAKAKHKHLYHLQITNTATFYSYSIQGSESIILSQEVVNPGTPKLGPEDFELKKVLGKGGYGKVFQV